LAQLLHLMETVGQFAESRRTNGAQGQHRMSDDHDSPLLASLLGQDVVVDLRSTYVCLGTFVKADALFLELVDADLHDLRDNPATREIYVYDSTRLGIRRNRARVLLRRDEIVAITRFADVLES
jgi:hypothetical protein